MELGHDKQLEAFIKQHGSTEHSNFFFPLAFIYIFIKVILDSFLQQVAPRIDCRNKKKMRDVKSTRLLFYALR